MVKACISCWQMWKLPELLRVWQRLALGLKRAQKLEPKPQQWMQMWRLIPRQVQGWLLAQMILCPHRCSHHRPNRENRSHTSQSL
jgi:hypothetical protein